MSIRLPKGWVGSPSQYAGQEVGVHQDTLSFITLIDDEYIGPDPVNLNRLAKIARNTQGGRILPHTTLAGSPAYHLAGKEGSITSFEKFGTVHEDRYVTVEFSFRVDFPRGQRAGVIESVLGSLAYR